MIGKFSGLKASFAVLCASFMPVCTGMHRAFCADAGPYVHKVGNHPVVTAFDLMDQTDRNNELLRTREWTMQWNEGRFEISCCALDVRDAENGLGRVFLRIAPLPHARPVACNDFSVDSRKRTVTVLSNGYPYVSRAYCGGKKGMIKAFHALQRQLRPYRPGRDGRILSNNWGGGYSDSRIKEEYSMREIEAGAKLGIEVIELDDGWQNGRSANSLLIKNRKKEGVWNGYWAFNPRFWDPDPVRFSRGLDPLVSRAKALGMDFGLWYGPDSSNDASNWERDADRILAYYRSPGIRYFKIDSMKSFSPLALSRQRAMFDKILAGSSSNVVFDLDVTAEIRPGYFGLPDIGTLFVENRYAKHCSWWPHQTLRNLWSLSHVVDPVRLRMEFLDPKQHADLYAKRYPWSPLRPELWNGDAVFATVMLSSPLAWMEIQGLQPRTVSEMAPLIAKWKKERVRMHTGNTFPVGAKPDGFSWTGFVVEAADGDGGYALLFRECNASSAFTIDVSPYCSARKCEVLSGAGTAQMSGTELTVNVPKKLGYVWVKLSDAVKVHPDTSGPEWKDVFKRDLSNAEPMKGVWSFDKDGCLVAKADRNIVTKDDYGNFTLDLEFKMEPGANSGVFIYASDLSNWIPNKIEIQLMDDHDPRNAKYPAIWKNCSMYGHQAPECNTLKPAGEWNRLTLWCMGKRIRIAQNGVVVMESDLAAFTDAKRNPDGSEAPKLHKKPYAEIATHGRIGFQGRHGGISTKFRNVKIKTL